MPPSESQISHWLKAARLRAGLTQIQAAQKAGVGYSVVTNSEQTGAIMAVNLIALVLAYDAAEAFMNQLGRWQGASGEVATATPVASKSRRNVNQGEVPVGRGTPRPDPRVSAEKHAPKKRRLG